METLKVAFASSAVLELVATLSVALVAVERRPAAAPTATSDFWTALVVLLLAPEAYWPLRRVGAEFHAAAEGTAAFEQATLLLTRRIVDTSTRRISTRTAVENPSTATGRSRSWGWTCGTPTAHGRCCAT